MFNFFGLFRRRQERKQAETIRIEQLEENLQAAALEQRLACQATMASASSLHKAVQANAACSQEATVRLKSMLIAEYDLEHPEFTMVPPAAPATAPSKSGLRKTQPLNTLGMQGQSA